MTEKRPRRTSRWGRRHPTGDPCGGTSAEREFAGLRRSERRGRATPPPTARPRARRGSGTVDGEPGERSRDALPTRGMTAEAAATILVVEDDPATRTFLADNLTADGYELLVADC